MISRTEAATAFCASHILTSIQAGGFPSPADDYLVEQLDLNEHLIKYPAATVFGRISDRSMKGVGIFDGDIVVIDRALKAKQNSVVVAPLDGEQVCKTLDIRGKCHL